MWKKNQDEMKGAQRLEHLRTLVIRLPQQLHPECIRRTPCYITADPSQLDLLTPHKNTLSLLTIRIYSNQQVSPLPDPKNCPYLEKKNKMIGKNKKLTPI